MVDGATEVKFVEGAGPAFVVTAGGDWEGLRTFDGLDLLAQDRARFLTRG